MGKEIGAWTWHIITAIVILVLLGLHMVIMHLDDLLGWFTTTGAAIDWPNVLARSKDLFFVILYTLLLAAALYHGLYGLRTICFEVTQKPGAQRLISILFWIAGIGLFGLGTYATLITYSTGAAS